MKIWQGTSELPLWLFEIDFPVGVLGAAFVLFRIFPLVRIPSFARSRPVIRTETVISCFWVESHDFPLLLDSESEGWLFGTDEVASIGADDLVDDGNSALFQNFLFFRRRVEEKNLQVIIYKL